MRSPLLALAATASLAVACSSDPPSPSRGYMNAIIRPGTEKGVNDQASCNLSTLQWLNVGRPEAGIESGTKQSESTVTVTCEVKKEGDGFRMKGFILLEREGSVSISGFFRPSGTQDKIEATFTRADTDTLRDSNCTVEYGPGQGVAAGRIWGKLTCAHASSVKGQNRTCLGDAEFKFETCDE